LAEGYNRKQNKDRVADYLIELNKGILFDELSTNYMKKAGVTDILTGVPVPITADAADELNSYTIATGMARVIGADNDFRYKDRYIEYLERTFGDNVTKAIISEGAKAGGSGDYETACAYFRAALLIEPGSRDALYLYGRALKDAYELESTLGEHGREDYIGNFKAESLEAFEILTMSHPDFYMGYYFLGYAYANLGMYTKAELTWETFMDLTEDGTPAEGVHEDDLKDLRDEISERLESLKDPVIIEQGVNLILSGDYIRGKEVLSRYKEGRYEQWWPLWYYLGIAETGTGNAGAAIEAYKTALKYSPSNIEVMTELVSVAEAIGDDETADKYRGKIRIVQLNMELEKEDLQTMEGETK
jgi:tetratricopeptide (TPR) repeat protein